MKNSVLFVVFLLFANISFAQTRNLKIVKQPTANQTNQKRKAMVIGMSEYGEGRSLNNTLNDANDMADALAKLGFEVTLLTNNDLQSLEANLNSWYSSIEGNDMAVFYYAGHGMEVKGDNYLIPVDFPSDLKEADVKYKALNVKEVLDNMDEAQINMKLLILDACRDNPFKRSWTRGGEEKGLAFPKTEDIKGTFIAFAAAPGSTAQDGENYNLHNGVFTYFLKQEIVKPGASIDNIFNKVTDDVSNLTGDRQTPFRNSSLRKDFYFIPPIVKPAPPVIDAAVLVRQADTLYNNKQYSEAFPLYKQAAESGNVLGQNMLSRCYYYGVGVTKDYEQALFWNKKAANQGNVNAQTNLGNSYFYGNGVKKDYIQAVYWYKQAADQGDAVAQTNFGVCYYNGWGVNQDYEQAVFWYKKAADQGKANAQYNLGTCYEDGNGVAKDVNKAAQWYKKAAAQGDADAKEALKRLGATIAGE